jgi:hypothetical protein
MTLISYLDWNGDIIDARRKEGAIKGLKLAAEHVLQVSRTRVPLEEGTLERSGVASVDSSEMKAAVSYDTVYAVYQHERLDLKHAPGRTAKYLEDPINEEVDTVREIVAAAVRRALS